MSTGSSSIGYERLNRRRNWITDHGARPEPGFDNTPAIWAAIRAALDPGGSGEVWIPETAGDGNSGAVFEIYQNNALHPQAAGASACYGLRFCGENMNRSILRLMRDSGNPLWLYDSRSLPGYNRGPQLENLWLQSDMPNVTSGLAYDPAWAADVNGLCFWANSYDTGVSPGGHDKGQRFNNVRINGFGTPLYWTGRTNTDSGRFDNVWFHNNGPIDFENDQTLVHLFYGCHFWYPQHCFRVLSTSGTGAQLYGGAGQILVHGGDIIHEGYTGMDTGVPYYFLLFKDGETRGAAYTRGFEVSGVSRFELRNINSMLVSDRGNVPFLPVRDVLFDHVDLSVLQGADVNGVREHIQLGPSRTIRFRDSSLPRNLGIKFYDHADAAASGYTHQGTVIMDHCAVDPLMVLNLKDRVLYDAATNPSGHGRVVSRQGRALTATNLTKKMSFDFDYSPAAGKGPGRGETSGRGYVVFMKSFTSAWPSIPSGVGAGERTVFLPAGTILNGISGRKPAGGGPAGTLVQYHVGKDDKSAIFASSAPARADGEHRWYADRSTHPDVFPYIVGADGEDVRLWTTAAGNNSSYSITGGEIALECA